MSKFNEKQVSEINEIISKIEKAIKEKGKKKFEIGSRDKTIMLTLMKTSKIESDRLFFNCRREYSDVIVSHFVIEKGLTKNKFSANAQENIYLLF